MEGEGGEHWESLKMGMEHCQRLLRDGVPAPDPEPSKAGPADTFFEDLNKVSAAQRREVANARKAKEKKKLSWDPRPPKVHVYSLPQEEIDSRKAHWRFIEAEARRMAQSAGAAWGGTDTSADFHPSKAANQYDVD
eukprot:CAMPEP_0202814068 /NCGR_PEP_ID=MMETSP1389-20130828/5264_1 /ASSEMBLY_ACC=CAM_ASM_000865 /TAXON_ID=302021 /ORGANISM="Rhodomonas sp., Strain CCMP768" /LENGTH=135 /DNA_ID=CAMNT_0049485761 /DNA_START=17 /DNA_END=424 /DNA_ORIENTATION=-